MRIAHLALPRSLGYVGTQPQPQQMSSTTAAFVLGGMGLLFFGIIALQFYKASKGIVDPVIYAGDGWGHHHDHGGLTLQFGRNARSRRSRRRHARRRGYRRSRR